MFDWVNALIMIVLCLICVYPMLYVLFASFSRPSLLARNVGPLFAPLGFSLEGYRLVLHNPNIASGYLNTIIYMVAGTLVALVMTVLAAYIASRTKWMWSKSITMLITFHMFFGGGLIPFYLLVRELHMIDTRWALIIPGALGVMNMIVVRTAIQGVPESLDESARIDGANDLTILLRIILPVITAAVAVQVLFLAVGQWNAWFNAMIFIRNRKLLPLQVILREILLTNDLQSLQGGVTATSADAVNVRLLTQYCTVVVATVPILCVYPFLQKYFVKGMLVGAVKG